MDETSACGRIVLKRKKKTGETRCDFGTGTKRCDIAYFHLHNKSSENLSSVCFLITQGKGFRVRQVVFEGRVSLLPACL